MGAVFAQTGVSDTKADARRGFKGYGPGSRKRKADAVVEKDAITEKLIDNFRGITVPMNDDFWGWGFPPEPDALKFYKKLTKLDCLAGCSAEEVEKFSLALEDLQDEERFSLKAGIFLSALINQGRDEEYTVHTLHLRLLPDKLGYWNRKKITVKGNVGKWVGCDMEEGVINIEGNADSCAGYEMKGGEIIIENDAADNLGCQMHSGKVVVKGDAGKHVAMHSEGGEVHIHGYFDYKFEYWYEAEIYHKGKLVPYVEVEEECPF